MLLYSPKAGRMTEHEDLGMNSQGVRMVKCLETGFVHPRESSKKRAEKQLRKKEVYKDRSFNEANDKVKTERGL